MNLCELLVSPGALLAADAHQQEAFKRAHTPDLDFIQSCDETRKCCVLDFLMRVSGILLLIELIVQRSSGGFVILLSLKGPLVRPSVFDATSH